jgi:hypothetical protein
MQRYCRSARSRTCGFPWNILFLGGWRLYLHVLVGFALAFPLLRCGEKWVTKYTDGKAMNRGYSTVQVARMLGMDKQMLLSLLEVPSCVQAPQGDDASTSMRPVAEVPALVEEDAKQHLDNLDKQMAAFKNQHVASSLGIDYDNARKVYQDDLAKQSTVRMASQMEQQAEGEQMTLLNPATLPDTPEFPNRLLFTVGGLIAGLVFGIGLALWLRYRPATLRIAPIPTTLQ